MTTPQQPRDHVYGVVDINNNVVIADHEYALQSGMPNECTYADDHDDITLHQQRQNLFSKMVKEVLEKENLFINESKTEHIVIKKDTRINEKWRLAKKLGTLLGDSEDIARRKQLACASMKSTKQLWTRRKLTKLNTKLKLHRTLVKSVLTYNLKTCGFTEYDRKKLDSFHRRQLKRILGISWPNTIRTRTLYKKTKSKPLSIEITEARWQYLGHVLQMDANAPARRAMAWYFVQEGPSKQRGRKRMTIVETINNDISLALSHFVSTS